MLPSRLDFETSSQWLIGHLNVFIYECRIFQASRPAGKKCLAVLNFCVVGGTPFFITRSNFYLFVLRINQSKLSMENLNSKTLPSCCRSQFHSLNTVVDMDNWSAGNFEKCDFSDFSVFTWIILLMWMPLVVFFKQRNVNKY